MQERVLKFYTTQPRWGSISGQKGHLACNTRLHPHTARNTSMLTPAWDTMISGRQHLPVSPHTSSTSAVLNQGSDKGNCENVNPSWVSLFRSKSKADADAAAKENATQTEFLASAQVAIARPVTAQKPEAFWPPCLPQARKGKLPPKLAQTVTKKRS